MEMINFLCVAVVCVFSFYLWTTLGGAILTRAARIAAKDYDFHEISDGTHSREKRVLLVTAVLKLLLSFYGIYLCSARRAARP